MMRVRVALAAAGLVVGLSEGSPLALEPEEGSRVGDDLFAMCGFGESGAPVFAGEGDSPFGVGSDNWCCGNTTWSSFSWRAKASRNVNFALAALSAPIQPGGLSNSTQCQLQRPTPPDCFGFCFNTTHNKACENLTAADEWSSWREFTPSAQAPSSHPPYAMSTVAAHYCGSYPNEFLDPIKHLVLKFEIHGVWWGNFSNVTLEVRPGGARAGKPTYQLHTQVAHLSSGFGKNTGAADTWPELPTGGSVPLTVPCMVARENLTAAENDGRPVRPIVTEREHAEALWAALPTVPKPPKKIIVVQGYHGENDVQGWRDAAKALVGFGTTGMGGTASVSLRAILDEAGITATRHQGSISGNVAKMHTSCRPSTETDHCWGDTDADVAANLKLWADHTVGPLKLAGVKKLTQFALHDELGWSYPGIWAGANNVSGHPSVFARFHAYIKNSSGLSTPEAFGAATWAEVVPISTANLTNVGGKHLEGLQNRLYWSMRFAVWDVTHFYSQATAALVKANGGTPFSIYTNCNNFRGRGRSPAKPPKIQAGTGVMIAQSDRQGMDWFEAGRLRAGTMMWTEDWFDDTGASEWSYLAARMRCAARLGGPDIQFGGYIVPRGPTGTAPRGTIGLLKRAVTLIGSGAKGMDYFEFGPEPMFPGNCFSAVAMRDPSHTMFKLIAEANRMIATADDLLYEGKMPVAEVAVLYPRSSWYWDNSTGITGACSNQPAGAKCKKLTPACIATVDLYCASQAPLQCSMCLSAWPRQLAAAGCPADNATLMTYCQGLGPAGPSSCEDQGETTMAYMGSIYGMFRYISQVHNVQLDFIDEDSLTAEGLKPWKALIITEPDIPAEGQAALAAWVQAGGHLMSTAGAAAYDRYHRPSTVLSAVTGFVEAPHERLMVQWSALLKVAASGVGELGAIEAYGVRSNLKSFDAEGFQHLAAFQDGTPAIVRNDAVGNGSATHFAFHPSLRFPNMNPYTGNPNFDQFEDFNDGTLPYLSEFLDNAGVTARVTVSSQQIETPLLVSKGGAVVTLLDWRPEDQQLPSINVTVRLNFDVTEVTAVRAGLKLHFTSVKQSGEFLISFATEVMHCDFITLEALPQTATAPLKSDDLPADLDGPGEAQAELHRSGRVRTLKPLWSVDEVPWLRTLSEDAAVTAELRGLADADGTDSIFRANFDPTHISSSGSSAGAGGTHGREDHEAPPWQGLPLMNRGQLLPAGCDRAPATCAALRELAEPYLVPRPPGATEVGVRLLKLQPGAKLRAHHGPGGRLVAHLGIRVPAGASMVVAGERVGWAEGEWTVFDDSYLHSAENQNEQQQARYILHVTFPHPDLLPAQSSGGAGGVASIATTSTGHFRLDFFADCRVQITNLRNQMQSVPQPLLSLYNKVADDRDSDWDSCVSAAVLPGAELAGPAAAADIDLRVTANHSYGSLDVGVKTSANGTAGWVTFQLLSLDQWHADPVQKHLKFAYMCPQDICSAAPNAYLPKPGSGVIGAAVDGLFQGWRGAEGHYLDSTGFLTISSDWQHANEMYFVKQHWKVAYTLCPTASLPSVWAGVRAEHPEIPKPNKNRARTWYWAGGDASTLDETIELVKSMGIELIFFGSFMNNIGDYTSDPVRWPNGLGAIRDRIHAAGLQIGLHIISPGSTVCLDQMTLPTSCKGNIHIDTDASRNHPELFMPQGPAPTGWYWANYGGTWYCHEQQGKYCYETAKADYLKPGPGHPIPAPPANHLELVGNVTWSTLGRFRSGGAIMFDGSNTSYGLVLNTAEYNFSHNEYYPTAKSEFTLQLTVHPVGPTTEKVQVLVDKHDEWRLLINAQGNIEWHVHLVSGWTVATGSRVLVLGNPYVVKATHAGGKLKVFTCLLADDFQCELGPTPEGQVQGECTECKEFWTNGTAVTGPRAASKVDCLYKSGHDGGSILWGAEQNAAGNGADRGFHGAMEEMFLSRLSLENISAHLYSCPACGCNNFYIWNYLQPATRAFWANGTAELFNEAGAEASQWDGTDMVGGLSGGFAHSKKTFSAGYPQYGSMSAMEAYVQSKSLWKQELAVETSGGMSGGLGEWHGDMMPFADEQLIKGGICVGGDVWHRGLLLNIVEKGLLFNAYNTPVETLHNLTEVDCFIGGLVATGIPPQMTAGTTPAAKKLFPRIKYWLDLYKVYGMATESSINVLHYPDVFLIGLTGGTEPGDHRGFFAGNTTAVSFPADLADNATVLAFLGYEIHSTTITFGSPEMKSFTIFAASDNATVHMQGGFWTLAAGQSMTETIIPVAGAPQQKVVPAGAKVHSVTLRVSEYARFEKKGPVPTLKTDDAANDARDAQEELRFLPCGAHPETWTLARLTDANILQGVAPERATGGELVAIKSASADSNTCISAQASGVVATVLCNASDLAQSWEWNGTAKNVLPAGQTGFVRSAMPTLSCAAKGGTGSEGCCLTNNGVAAVWGCCPYTPSDCGNQVIVLQADGTLRDARHPTDCLMHGAAPAPPPPPPPLGARVETFEKLGMMDYESYESTPLVFAGKKLLMETIALVYPGHISHWRPEYKSCSSYFRVRDLTTGHVLVNLTQSCNHSFGSAFVDKHENGSETLWILGSNWYRPAAAVAATPARAGAGLLGQRTDDGWGGSCKNGTMCTIGAFWTSDPSLQGDWQTGTALSPGRSSWNCDVTTGKPQQDGSKTFVMALEQQPLPGAPAGSGWTSYFYIKDEPKGSPAYGDLTKGWRLLPTATHVIGGTGTHGACPTIRWFPDDAGGMYYVISGGLSVYLDRSRDLTHFEPSKQHEGVVLQTTVNDTKVCTEYIGYQPRASEQALLASAKAAFPASCSWDCDASDVDLCELDDGTTLFYFLSGNQGNHIFAALGQHRGSMRSWFEGQY